MPDTRKQGLILANRQAIIPNPRHLEIRSLRAFVTVAEELHFGRAARRLAISQPTLTQQIQHLEKQVGKPLFLRSNRMVLISEHGRRLLDHARALVTKADSFLQLALQSNSRLHDGQLHVGFLATAMVSPAREFYRRIVSDCPNVVPLLYEMHTTEQIEALLKGILDIGVINRPTGESHLRLHRLVSESCVIAVAVDHPLARHRQLSFERLSATPIVLPARHTAPGAYDQFVAACVAGGFSPNIAYQTCNFWTAANLAMTGLAAAIVPESVASIPLPGVTYLRFRNPQPIVELFAAWDPGNRSPLLKQVLQQLGPEA